MRTWDNWGKKSCLVTCIFLEIFKGPMITDTASDVLKGVAVCGYSIAKLHSRILGDLLASLKCQLSNFLMSVQNYYTIL